MATICEQTEPQFILEGQGWLEMRLMRDKHELLEENIQLRKDLLHLQQEHITVLQQLAVCHAAEQQQRQVATADEQPAVSQTSTEPEQISATLQAQQQVLPEQQQQQQQQCLTAKLHPARQHSHHHHHHHHHHHRHSSKPPLTPQYQPSSSTAFLGMLTEGLFRDTCSSPSPASNRPASRESQGSSTPRAKLHSSLQRLFGRNWVGQLQRSMSSGTFSADMAHGSNSTAHDGGSSSSNVQLGSSTSRNVVDVAMLIGMPRRGSGGGSNGGRRVQRREGIISRAARISSGGAAAAAAAAALGTMQLAPHPHIGLNNTGQQIGAATSRHWSSGGNGSSGGSGRSWRNCRPAALTHLRPAAAFDAAASSSGIVPVPAGCSVRLAVGGAVQAADVIDTQNNSSSSQVPEVTAAAVWELYGPLSCPAAVQCETPWGGPPGPVERYNSSNSGSSSTGSSTSCRSSGDGIALIDDCVELVSQPGAGLMLSRLNAVDGEGCGTAPVAAAAAAAAVHHSSTVGWSHTSSVSAAKDDCLPVADAGSAGQGHASAVCAMPAAASGCPCMSSAVVEGAAAVSGMKGAKRIDTITAAAAAAAAAAGAGRVEGSSTGSEVHSIAGSSGGSLAGSSTSGSCGGSSSGGCSSTSGLAGRASPRQRCSNGCMSFAGAQQQQAHF